MRIERLDLVRYGAFAERTVDFGPAPRDGSPDLHIVFGPNEAGKSTLFSAWLDLLFGFKDTAYDFDHKRDALLVRGALGVGAERRTIERAGAVELAPEDADAVRAALGALERDDYATMFSLDTEELETGGRAILSSEGRLGELLFSAGSGLSSLSDTLARIDNDVQALFKFDGRNTKSEIAAIRSDMIDLDRRIQDADLRADQHEALIERRDRARTAYEVVEGEYGDVRGKLAETDRLLHALVTDDERRAALNALTALGELPEAPPSWREQIGPIGQRLAARAERERMLAAKRAAISEERGGLVPDEAAFALADRLAALEAMRDDREALLVHRMGTGLADLGPRMAELADAQRDVSASLARLDMQPNDTQRIADVPADAVERLRELASDHAGLTERVRVAQEEVERSTEALEEANRLAEEGQRDEDGLIDDRALGHIRAAVRAVVRSGVISNLSDAKATATRERARLDALLRDAGITYEHLASLPLPSDAQVTDWIERSKDMDRQVADNRDRIQQLLIEHEGLATRGAARAIPSENALRDIRERRDHAWTAHREELTPSTADAFAALLAENDALVERRLAGVDLLIEQRTDDARMAMIAAELAQRERQRAEYERARDDLSQEIASRLEGAGHAGLLSEQPTALDAAAYAGRIGPVAVAKLSSDQAEAAAAACREQAERAVEELAEAMPVELRVNDPAVALEQAEDWIETARARVESAGRAMLAVRERQRNANARCDALHAAMGAIEAWRAGWNTALARTFLHGDGRSADRDGAPRVGVVMGLLDEARKLSAALEKQRSLETRIAAMERDRDRFLAALAALAEPLGLNTPTTKDWQQVLATVRDRVATACKVSARLEALASDQANAAREASAIEREAVEDDALLSPMREALGTEEPAEIARKLERIAERDGYREDVRKALARSAATLGTTCDEASAILERADRDALGIERDRLASEEIALGAARDEARDAYTEARKALADVGGDGTAARLVAERQTLAEQLADRASLALALELGNEAAKRALNRYRDAHRSGMMERASDAFARISCGAFGGLDVVPTKAGDAIAARRAGPGGRLIGVQAPKPSRGRKARGDGGLSKGTRHQLYLALRMAGYHEYASKRVPPPFVCDDVMETFDDDRSAETLRLFGDMATRGQVIVLTHHSHLLDLAKRTVPAVRCHELPGPVDAEPKIALAAE